MRRLPFRGRLFPLGLFLATASSCHSPSAAARAPVDWARAAPVAVAAVEYRFEPAHLVLARGVAYRLQVINRGRELHELTAPAFFRAIEMRDPAVLNPERTEIAVQPGEDKTLFFVARRSGHFKMWCADHDWAGMTGTITVK